MSEPSPEPILTLLSDGQPMPLRSIKMRFENHRSVEANVLRLVDDGHLVEAAQVYDLFTITAAGLEYLETLKRERLEAEHKLVKQGSLFE